MIEELSIDSLFDELDNLFEELEPRFKFAEELETAGDAKYTSFICEDQETINIITCFIADNVITNFSFLFSGIVEYSSEELAPSTSEYVKIAKKARALKACLYKHSDYFIGLCKQNQLYEIIIRLSYIYSIYSSL